MHGPQIMANWTAANTVLPTTTQTSLWSDKWYGPDKLWTLHTSSTLALRGKVECFLHKCQN